MFSQSELIEAKERIIQQHGAWTAHNLHLGHGVYTIAEGEKSMEWIAHRSEYFTFLARMALRSGLEGKRVLDLGSLEGGLSIKFAQGGAKEVVGVEIRSEHLAKANFAKDALNLQNLRFERGDMLKLGDALDEEPFDIVICAGVLYHVDAPDLLPLLTDLQKRCRGVLLIDTHVSQEYREQYEVAPGFNIFGRSLVEHPPAGQHDKEKRLWASWDNNFSFVVTERSLANLLASAGFGFVTKPLYPFVAWNWQDRDFWMAYSKEICQAEFSSKTALLSEPDVRAVTHEMFLKPATMNAVHPKTKRLMLEPSDI